MRGTMGLQFGIIGAFMVGAMIAVPICHEHRMSGVVFFGTLWAFTFIPLLVGLRLKKLYRPVVLVAIGLLLLAPLIYVITDSLDVQFERLRDGYFLGTFSVILLASSAWLVSSYRSGEWVQHAAAVFVGTSSALAIFILLWMIMVFE